MAASEKPARAPMNERTVQPSRVLDGAHDDGRTINIGLGAGMTVIVLVIAVIAGVLWARVTRPGPQPSAGIAPTSASAAVLSPPAAAGPASIQPVTDGQLAPGVALEVSDPSHPLYNASPPEIAGKLLDGTAFKLSDYAGQPVVVNFWATWCPPCRLEMPWLEEAYEANKGKGLILLGVNAGEKVAPGTALDLVKDYVGRNGITFPIVMPDDAYSAQYNYQVYGLPSTYFVGRDGKISDVVRGAFPNRATLDARLAAYWQAWQGSAP